MSALRMPFRHKGVPLGVSRLVARVATRGVICSVLLVYGALARLSTLTTRAAHHTLIAAAATAFTSTRREHRWFSSRC